MMIEGLLWLLVWALLVLPPGYLMLRLWDHLFFSHKSDADLCEILFLSALLGTLTLGWFALSMLQVGCFDPILVVALAFIIIIVFAVSLWRLGKRVWISYSVTTFTWLFLLLFMIGIALYFHPGEFILGGGDAGVYINLGSIWASSGSFSFIESGLQSLPGILRSGLFRQVRPDHVVTYVRFPGFYLSDDIWGKVIPQFFPLHPTWLSIAHGLLGLRGSLFVTPLWAVGGLLALVLTCRYLFGEYVGLISGVLLLISPLQIYFSRYPTAEPLTQFLLWSGIYAFVKFVSDRHLGWALVSAYAVGQVFLTRIDAIPLLLLPGFLLVLTIVNRSWREEAFFLIPFTVIFLQSLVQAIMISQPYTWEIYNSLFSMGKRILSSNGWLMSVGLVLGLIGFLLLRKVFFHRKRDLIRGTKWLGALLVFLLGFFAYFIWPRIGEAIIAPYWYGDNEIPIQNHLNLLKFAWYISPLGVWLGILGIVWLIIQERWARVWPLLIVGLSFSLLYFYNILNNPFHIYAMRRYVPAVLPFFVVGMAYGLGYLWTLQTRNRWTSWLAVVMGLGLFGWLIFNGRSVWTLIEHQGLINQVNDLAGNFNNNAVLLVDDASSVGAGATVGTPLQYIFEIETFDLQENELNEESLLNMIDKWQQEDRSVYWGLGPNPVGVMMGELSLVPAVGTWLHYPQLEQSYYNFPTRRLFRHIPLEFYQIVKNQRAETCSLPVTVDIGTLDTIFLNEGFHSKEWLDARSARWTEGVAVLTLPCLPSILPEEVILTASVGAIRAFGSPPTDLTLYLNDTLLGIWSLENNFHDVEVAIPSSLLQGENQHLRIVSDTWIPQEAGVGQDNRVLGVLIDSITLSAGDDVN